MQERKSTGTSYERWMQLLDDGVWERLGCSLYDLPDMATRDWYDADVGHIQAVEDVVERCIYGNERVW